MVVLALQVTESSPRDVGRGVVRLHPKDMADAAWQSGDIVCITGKRKTVARALPSYGDERSRRQIQMDGLLRDNADTALGERVEVEKTRCPNARSVQLRPSNPEANGGLGSSQHMAEMLDGVAVVPGDRVRVTFLSGQYHEFIVTATQPSAPVAITRETLVKLQQEQRPHDRAERTGVTYEDIGGLRREIQRIREMVELPLRYPEAFQQLGIGPPKGVLLYGPPGCGKTLIAKAIASETSAYFTTISGPEIIGKYYGESEERLRNVFLEAEKHAPAIVFIDEIDAIAPKRGEMGSHLQVERRVVAQLLALLDGLHTRGQVIVIGATNVEDTIDPALRRPGRLEREIGINVPDRIGRYEILQVHTRGMPLADDVDLERLAEVTHGFVGADLAALCREAALVTLREAMPALEFDLEFLPREVLGKLEVAAAHFWEALKEIEPSAIREVFTEVPRVNWDDLGGMSEVKQRLQEVVEWPLRYPHLFEEANTRPPKGLLLAGPPGSGKTLLGKAAAHQTGVNFISVKGPALLSKWVGESERAVREIFRKAKLASPCIIFFDEIDALASSRGSDDGSHVSDRVLAQLLTELDGIEELKGVVVIGATNRPDLLDPALLRAGRLEFRLDLPVPDAEARREIFAIHTRSKPLAEDVDLTKLALKTDGAMGSDIEAICRRAALAAIRDALGRDHLEADGTGRVLIEMRHFEEALPQGRSG